jgi:hypothetical protein
MLSLEGEQNLNRPKGPDHDMDTRRPREKDEIRVSRDSPRCARMPGAAT